jgi:O-acetylhomoserine/O-acetylserine sulfhydrylase-like pyridoxal-dependent enzyme
MPLISHSYVRPAGGCRPLSAGIEDWRDLRADFEQSLAAKGGSH